VFAGSKQLYVGLFLCLLLEANSPQMRAQEVNKLSWLDRATITRSSQPHWVTPLITASANLEEAPIYDTARRITPHRTPVVIAGGPRGVQFVPIGKLQVTFGATPYTDHYDSAVHDGFGDTSFAFKYRMLSGNEEHGDYAVSVQLGASIPTGTYQNGQRAGTLTPNLLAEKAWGPFAIQTTFGVTLPTSDTRQIGRTFISNTAFQGHFARIFWPELETNFTNAHSGPANGNKQLFLTPGLLVGHFHLTRSMGITFGVGMQIAVTQYHTYNHSLLFSIRLPLQSHPPRPDRLLSAGQD
jgi:Putative MetA-pathway of phenol degradation